MSEAVLSAVITGAMSLAGVICTCLATARRQEQSIRVSQAVTDTRLEELTREVREHNGFARRMPVVENQIQSLAASVAELREYHK